MSSTKPKARPSTGPHTRAHTDRAKKPQVSLVCQMGMPGTRDRARVTATISAANTSRVRQRMA